jgi:hypothetical protein
LHRVLQLSVGGKPIEQAGDIGEHPVLEGAPILVGNPVFVALVVGIVALNVRLVI